jgi:hypothetical protein
VIRNSVYGSKDLDPNADPSQNVTDSEHWLPNSYSSTDME